MKIHTEIIGNLHDPEWREKTRQAEKEYIDLDQWTAQKSRFVVRSDRNEEYAVALKRHAQLADGDIIEYLPEQNRIVAIRIRLNDVLVADLSALAKEKPETVIHISVELGHAIGNQHWPAVVKGTKVYVPLTVDRKVMESVMRTHRIEGVGYGFQPGSEVIPYLTPHEIRRLFGGTGPDSDVHSHHKQEHEEPGKGKGQKQMQEQEQEHEHTYTHRHEHSHEYGMEHEHGHSHTYSHVHAHEEERTHGHEHRHEEHSYRHEHEHQALG